MPCAFGTAAEGELAAAARAAMGTDGRDLVSTVTTDAPYRRGSGPLRVVAYDFGVKETMLRHLGDLATVTVVPASTGGRRGAGPRARRRVPLQRARRPRRPRRARSRRWPTWWAGSRCSGSASATRCWPRRSAAAPTSCPSATTAANHPVQRLDGGHVEMTSQNHNYAVTEVPRTEVTHVNLNDGVVEGFRSTERRRLLGPVPPRGRPGPPRRPLPLRRVPGPHGGRGGRAGGQLSAAARRHLARSWSSARARSSSARPASSTTRGPRPAGSWPRRATGWSWPTPTRPRS